MICWQVYASNFMHLTKWKGGGYGMYTDVHPERRSIVLKTRDSVIRLFPLATDHLETMDPSIQKDYEASREMLKFAAFFPEYYKEQLYEVPYLQHFELYSGKIEFYESYVDLRNRKAYSKKFYEYE